MLVLQDEVVEDVDSRPDALDQVTSKALQSVHNVEESRPQVLELCLICQLTRSGRHNCEVLFQNHQSNFPRGLIDVSKSCLDDAPVLCATVNVWD